MFIVQDRQTGRYYRNTSGRGNWRRDGDWVIDLQDVKPFRTMGAVRNLFMGSGSVQYQFQQARWEMKKTGLNCKDMHECCLAIKFHIGRQPTNQCEHFKAAVAARKERARARYRVLKVVLKLAEEQEL